MKYYKNEVIDDDPIEDYSDDDPIYTSKDQVNFISCAFSDANNVNTTVNKMFCCYDISTSL